MHGLGVMTDAEGNIVYSGLFLRTRLDGVIISPMILV
jgi:hypothetical protein